MSPTDSPHRSRSLWLDTVDDDLTARPSLEGDADVDVAIVGAGFTGLWTAYALLDREPALRILVVEREIAGFGASGRNGGWASDLFPASWAAVARRAGHEAAVAMHRALVQGIDDIAAAAEREGIDIAFARGGSLRVARTAAQERAIREEVAASRSEEPPDLALAWLDRGALAQRIRVSDARGASYTPHCARVHPGRLVRGLARAVEKRGARIAEQTAALAIEPHRVITERGTVHARHVVRATEAYTTTLRGARRELLPLYSLMIATAPLPEKAWHAIGWDGAETLADGRHLIIYAQRTADGRVAFGGRGAPYHFGSRVTDAFDSEPSVFQALEHALHDLLPPTRGVPITHRWGGAIGVARDWFPSVCLDNATGIAWAGGYVGDGVTASNVAGRTIADLLLGLDTPLTGLPWVQHRSRRWEPEPLRWLGVNLGVHAMRSADDVERRTGRPSWRARAVSRLQGGR